jgi:hypothetical protein
MESDIRITQAMRQSTQITQNARWPCELVGFDRTQSIAPAVQVDLLFLRRAFKGRLLIINQDWSILGRDILNHLVLLLDGPGLTWSEFRSTQN